MAEKWDGSGECGRLDLSLAVTDSREIIHEKGRTDVREDGREGHILSTDQEVSTAVIPRQQMTKPEQTEVVEVNRLRSSQRSKAGRIAHKHAPPSDIHCLSDTTVLEGAVTERPATEDMLNRSSSFSNPVHVSVEKKDSLGCRDYLGMKTHGDAAAFEGGTVASLPLNSPKKGDPIHCNTVLEPWQPLFQHPPNDQAFTSRPIVDEQGDVSTSHQALSIVENQEEKRTFCSVLHQMQQQQKRRPGRRFKKKTLVKMAKLFVIAQGWDSETTVISKVKSSNQPPVKCERSETQKTEDTTKSISSNTSQSETVNITSNSVDDRGDDFLYKESALPTNSVDVISASKIATPKMLTEFTKTCKRKTNPTTSKKQKSRESKLSSATKMVPDTSTIILDTPVLPQDTLLQVKEFTVQKKSKKINSTTLKEEGKISDDTHIHSDNTAPVSSHDTTPKPNTNKTSKDSKDSNNAAVKNNITKSSSKKSVDCNGVMSLQAVTEGPLVLAVTQKDQRKPKDGIKAASCTTVTEWSTAAEIHNKEPSVIKSTGEVLKLKRKRGRPFKKKTLMKMSQLLATAQEGESNRNAKQCNITEDGALFLQQQYLPNLPQASFKLKKTKKDTKITASSSSTSPARRSPRTQSHHTPILKSAVENIDSRVYTSPETVLITSGPVEPIVKVETSACAPLLLSSNDELSTQSETQGTAVENIKGWSVHPKKKRRKSTQQASRDSCPSQLILDESVEKGLTKTIKAGRKNKTAASKSNCKTGRNTVKFKSSYGISKKVQTRTGDDEVYDVSAPREANPIPQLQKPTKRAVKNKKCKVEPTDLPLSSCQTEPSDSLCESGMINHSASSLLTTRVKTDPACEQVTPPMTKKRNSKTKRVQKRPSQKRLNEPVLTLNATIGGESGSPSVQCTSTQEQGKQVKEETSVIKDPQKPDKGTAQRKSRKGGEKGGRRKQNAEPDLDVKCVQPEQITSQQPDSIPTEIKTEPDETYATPIKVTKAKPGRKRKLPLKDTENTKRPAMHRKAIKDGNNAVSLITGNILGAADQLLMQLEPKNKLKVETDNISTAKHAAFVATDNKHNQNATLQGSLATSNITKSEGVIATPKKVKNNVKTVRKRKIVSKQTKTNDRTIVSTLITSTSMSQNSSPVPQSVSTVTSSTAQGQIIESKPCSQGTKMSKVLADHGPYLKEHKTHLQCLSAFVQDTFEDPKILEINRPRESTKFQASNNVSDDKFVITENPQRNEKNKGKKKLTIVEREQSTSTELVNSDTKIKEVIANPEDGFETSLTDDLQMRSAVKYNRKKKCKSVKGEQTVVPTTEENNSGEDEVPNLHDNPTDSLTENPKADVIVMEKSTKKYKTAKQKQLMSDKVVDGVRTGKEVVANSGDGLIASLKKGSQMNQKGQLKGKKKCLAVKGKPQEAASVEENTGVAGEVPIAENGLTTSLTEKQMGDMKGKGKKCKAIKGRLALVGSFKGSTRVVDKGPNPVKASQTANKPGDVKVKPKNKPKSGKQELSLAKSVENSIVITALLTKPEDNAAASLKESLPETVEIKIKDKKKTKTVIKKQTGVGTKKRGKALADKVPTPRNSLKASMKGCSLGNLTGKSKGKKKTKPMKEENTAATLSEDTSEMENIILNSKDDPKTSIGDDSVLPNASLKGNLDKKSQVTTKRIGKTKCKAVKEELTATTLVKEEMVNNQTDAVKSKRKVGRPLKKKTLRIRKQLSSEQQKSETDTDAHVNQNIDGISKVICKRGKIKAPCLPTTTRRPRRASQVAKIEDAVSSYEPDLAASSLTQDKSIPSMDLNVVKQEQDSSEMSKEYFKKASDSLPEEIGPPAYGVMNKEFKQDESISGTAQRKSREGGEKGGRRKQNAEPDLDVKCVQPEQITSQQPDSIPTEIKTEPDETYATYALATSNITKSEAVIATPKKVKNNVKTIRKRKIVSKQTKTNDSTIVSTLITSTSMSQNSSPAPQSLSTVTSSTAQGQIIESKPCSQGTKMSKVLADHGPYLKEHKTHLQCLSAFVQDTFEDPKILKLDSSEMSKEYFKKASDTLPEEIVPPAYGVMNKEFKQDESISSIAPIDSVSKVICKRGKIEAPCLRTTIRRPCRASQVAKIEDAVCSYEPDLAASSLTQDKQVPSMDLNVVKQEQDSSEMSKEYFKKASDSLPEEIVPPAYGNINKEVKQDESITKSQTTTSKKKRRRNKTGWDTKKKSKRLRSNVNCSTTVEVVDHSSMDSSGLSFNSSICNSILDEEIISLELKNVKDNLSESHSSEVSPTNGKTSVNIKQTHTALNRNYIKDMTTNTKSKHSANLKHSTTRQQKFKKKPIECSFCGRSFRHISAFTVHKRIHTGEKPYRCLKCGKSFAQLSKLYLHSDVHKERGAIQCPFCVCKFTNKDELIAHLKIHVRGTKKFNLINNSREGEDTHSQQKADRTDSPVTPNDRMAFRCSTCFKEFLNKATFKMHRQTHCEAKPHTCSICGGKFSKSSSLNVHEKTHWPVKPYACTVCGKGFVKLKELKSHSHMHSGEMPFFCANCGQDFSNLASLRSHQVSKVCFEKTDEGDRNKVDIEGFLVTQGVEGQINTPMYYKCPICKRLHHHWCHYILHLQTHSKSQPYLCETCGQHYDRVAQTYIHCKVCCNLSGEERACNSSLSEIWEEPETTIDQILEPQLDSLSNDDHEISPVGDQKLQSQEQLSVSSPLETIEKEITDMLPTPLPPRSPSPDCQSVSNYLDIRPHSSSNSDCGNADSASPSVISCGSEQIDPQPPRFHSRSLIHRHHGRYSCGQCGKSFNQWNKLWLHQGLHRQRGSSLSCTQCGLEFRFFSSYMDHLLKHAAQKPYACPLCPKTFATEEDLNTHHCECHKPRDCAKCTTCGKDFTSVRKLKRHCLLHKGIFSHFCLPCNLSFPSNGALQNHLKTHRVRPSVPLPEMPIEPFLFPYHCRKCTAKFTSSDLLQAHQVCHFIAGRKPSSPPADVLSRLPIRDPGTDAQAVISESPQQIRSLPVSNKKHLFRYPHPDRLYVVPVVSSEPLVIISDTEEEIVVVSPSAPNSTSGTVLPPVNERQLSANNDSLDQNVSNIPQSSTLYTPMVIDEPEPAHCWPLTQTDTPHRPVGDPLLPRALDQVPIHNESHQNHERPMDIDVASDCGNDSIEASTTLMTPKEKECSIDVHNCAVCKEDFTTISKLHEHYLDHARGM